MNAHRDSPTDQEFHVRYRIRGREEEGPYWSHVHDEETAREVLASFERNAGLVDVGLWVREVTPWERA